MPLEHTRPQASFLRELDEVARSAEALVEFMARGLNFPLPPEFPVDQLADICRSLMRLPDGTAEGARSPLDYARLRLPAIRRQYVLSEGLTLKEEEPALTRGAALDQKLTALMSAVSTAFDEYRSLASEEPEDFKVEAGIILKKGSVDEATSRSAQLDQTLEAQTKKFEEMADPVSAKADDLTRQLKDARGLNQLASAEMRMPRVVVGWLRKSLDALKKSPAVIGKTVASLRVGVDVTQVFVDRWHEFEHNGTGFIFDQIRKTLDSFEKAADIIVKAQGANQEAKEPPPVEEPTQVDRARSRRVDLHHKVRQHLDELDALDRADPVPDELREVAESDLFTDLRELGQLETFIGLHRQFSTEESADSGDFTDPGLGRAGHGMSQRVFVRLAIIAIRRAGHPLDSGAVVDWLRKMGQPVGGSHEVKTAYNRLWEAKRDGILVHVKDAGYWIAGVELPQKAIDRAAAARSERRKNRPKGTNPGRRPGGRHGAPPKLSPPQIDLARKMLRSGKPVTDVAAQFGVSIATMKKYLRKDIQELKAVNGGHLPRRRIRRSSVPRNFTKRAGRRSSLSDEQIARIVEMRETGNAVQAIAAEFGVSIDIVYRQLRYSKKRTQS